jgi:hypothetical protein
MKRMTSIRLSEHTDRQLAQLTDRLGVNQSEIISIAIDRMARQEINTMNGPQTFPTKEDADEVIAGMKGWDANAVEIESLADERGRTHPVWVIQCDGDQYLCWDGFVR